MIMKASWTIDDEIVELSDIITCNDKKLLSLRHSVKQPQQSCLWFHLTIRRLDIGKRLVKLVKKNHNTLVNRFYIGGNPWNILVHQNDWNPFFHCLYRQNFCKHRFSYAFVTTQNHSKISVKLFISPQNFLHFLCMLTIYFVLF